MKKITSILILSILFSCGGKKTSDKQEQLEKLRKQQSEIAEQIKKLEAEMPADTSKAAAEKIKNVAVTKVAYQPFKHFIEVQGKVDADENIAVSAKMGGTITKILVSAGDRVKKGQVLAEMDAQITLNGIEELKTQIVFTNNLYDKQKKLWEQHIGTELQYLSAKNNKEALEKKLATLGEQYDMSKIKSPIDGTVDEVSLKIGQGIMPGMPAVRVVNFSKLKVKAEVAESYIQKIKKGNEVILFFPDLNEEIKAKISYSANVINPTNRTFTIEILMAGEKENLHPNMIAIIKVIDFEKENAIVIPINTVQNSDEGKYVFVAANENGKMIAKKRLVTVNTAYNGMAEISSGLKAGDDLITTGYQSLNDGEVIKF